MFIFGTRKFHPRRIIVVRKTGAENRRQKMESIYGAVFWSVCHGYKSPVPLRRHHSRRSFDCVLIVVYELTGRPNDSVTD